MMKAILVDDESLALKSLQHQLGKLDGIEVIASFQDPAAALQAILEQHPDVVFLDIEMPVLSGIELAERLHDQLPDVHLVFITAYDEYAIKAFELNAVDYLLKPFQTERLQATISRLSKFEPRKTNRTQHAASHPSAMIRCFQSLQYETDQPSVIPWRTTKAQQLFAFLIHHRGQQVRKDTILDMLWPEAGLKKGMTQMYTAMYQVRKTIQACEMQIEIHSFDKSYMLDLKETRLDIEEWERGLQGMSAPTSETLHQHKQLLELYRGDYLADYDYIWAENERERLRSLWYQHATDVAACMAAAGQYVDAVAMYTHVRESFPFAETIYWELMKLHDAHGDFALVQKQFHELLHTLQEELGIAPQADIRSWYEQRLRALHG